MKMLFLIIAMVSLPGKNIESAKPTIENVQVIYNWYNLNGTYLRTKTLQQEYSITGYDNNPAAPATLRERGYTPANCSSGTPPVPNDPDAPDQNFYSHP
jgi:hypothetical protein